MWVTPIEVEKNVAFGIRWTEDDRVAKKRLSMIDFKEDDRFER